MANFQPGLSFVSDYMTRVNPGWDSNLCTKNPSITANKMVRKRVLLLELSALIFSQLGLLLALNSQLFGIVLLHQMVERKWYLALAAHISARKCYIYQRQRQSELITFVERAGQFDQWRRNMIGKDVPIGVGGRIFECPRNVSMSWWTNVVPSFHRTQTSSTDGLLKPYRFRCFFELWCIRIFSFTFFVYFSYNTVQRMTTAFSAVRSTITGKNRPYT